MAREREDASTKKLKGKEYEQELERRKARGESEQVLHDRYGLGVYDLRETLQEALPGPPR